MDVPERIDLAQILADIERHTQIRYPVVYDPELRARYAAAQEAVERAEADLAQARKRHQQAVQDAYMSEAPAAPDEARLTEAQAALDAVREGTKGHQLIVVFRGQTSDYDDWVAEAAKAELVPNQVFRLYCEKAWAGLETVDGARVDATLPDVVEGLMTAGDRFAVGRKIIEANEGTTSLPF